MSRTLQSLRRLASASSTFSSVALHIANLAAAATTHEFVSEMNRLIARRASHMPRIGQILVLLGHGPLFVPTPLPVNSSLRLEWRSGSFCGASG